MLVTIMSQLIGEKKMERITDAQLRNLASLRKSYHDASGNMNENAVLLDKIMTQIEEILSQNNINWQQFEANENLE